MSEDQPSSPVFHELTDENSSSLFSLKSFLIFVVVIILAIGAGYFLSKGKINSVTTETSSSGSINGASIAKGTVIGSDDTTTFKDMAEGVLQKGGINGEGAFHLVRPGGDSQNVYLTSSIVDLSQFIGKKIKVHGQTQKANTAGWLMDVGQVEVE